MFPHGEEIRILDNTCESTDSAVCGHQRLKYRGNYSVVVRTRLVWINKITIIVADPGSGAFLTPGPGSGIRNRFFPDSGSRESDPGSETQILVTHI